MTASHLFLLSKLVGKTKHNCLWVGKHLNEKSAENKALLKEIRLENNFSLNVVLAAVTRPVAAAAVTRRRWRICSAQNTKTRMLQVQQDDLIARDECYS